MTPDQQVKFYQTRRTVKAVKQLCLEKGLIDPAVKWIIPKRYVKEVMNGTTVLSIKTLIPRLVPDYKTFLAWNSQKVSGQ